MTKRNLDKITAKYTPQEITTAVRVLVDVLALQQDSDFKTVDIKQEFTPQQIKRLRKQLRDHKKDESGYLSLTEVSRALGL